MIDLNVICKRCEHPLYKHLWRTAKYHRTFEVAGCKAQNGDCRCVGFTLTATKLPEEIPNDEAMPIAAATDS